MFFRKKDPLAYLDVAYTPVAHRSSLLRRALKVIINYLLLTGVVFAVLLLGANFSAYSQILMNYIDPESAERS
jgi:hypothetical protein